MAISNLVGRNNNKGGILLFLHILVGNHTRRRDLVEWVLCQIASSILLSKIKLFQKGNDASDPGGRRRVNNAKGDSFEAR